MPSKPPRVSFRPASPPRTTGFTKRVSRHERGYGRAHDLMRQRVLREEPLCRACTEQGRVTATTIADHVIPKAEGGTDERENYQGLCDPCHKAKTACEAARAKARGRRT